jgi:hypothetical protein
MNFEELCQTLTIPTGSSKIAHNHGVVVSVQQWDSGSATLVFGTPGLVNETRKLSIGEAAIYQTPTHGNIEIRLLSRPANAAEILLTKIQPWLGFEVSASVDEGENTRFTKEEILRIKGSIDKIKLELSVQPDIPPNQYERLAKQLDEISAASERIGRKDWVMFVVGTLSSIATNTYLPAEIVKPFVASVQANLGWIFHAAVRLIG